MAKTLSQIGIETNYLVRAGHVSQSIDALTGAEDYDITISGSLTITGSVYINGLTTSSDPNVLTYDSTTGKLAYTASSDLSIKNALTASYVNLNAGTNIIINKLGTAYYISSSGGSTGNFVTTSSFNAFTGSYRTGSFTGSFTGSLLGTASYVNLKAGPNITINQSGITFYISGSSGTPDTSSLLITASGVSSGIEFTKGNNSKFTVNFPGVLTNLVTDWSNPQYYQIPGGNYRIIVSSSISAPGTSKYLILPTQSYVVGDIIEVTGVGEIVSPYLVISQSRSTEQMIGPISSQTTIGVAGYANLHHRDYLILTCVESSSTSNVWAVSNFYGDSLTLY